MLNPHDRHLLLEGLRPPPGYVLSQALGTSYSLDLLALLAAPLAFTFFDWEDKDGEITSEPLALLDAVRRHAGKITLFCHAGNVKVPPPSQRLLAYLERSVVEVLPAKDGAVFHPKVWVLRFENGDDPVRYRFLCLSRNLTFDRSWDTVLSLDGVLEERQRGFARNRPLSDFIAALPSLAVRPISTELSGTVARAVDEIRKVRFELPDGVEDFGFWPLGIGNGKTWPYPVQRRPILVLSPFLAPACLNTLSENRRSATLVSRAEELAKIDQETLSSFDDIYTLDASAELDDDGDLDESPGPPGLSGLHAKLVVMDDGWNARVFTGSANATDAAFNGNVEFVTELVGKKKSLGVDAFLGTDGKAGQSFTDMLQPWQGTLIEPSEADRLRERLERELRIWVAKFARAKLRVSVGRDDEHYALRVTCAGEISAQNTIELVCWPSSLRDDDAVAVNWNEEVLAAFSPLSLTALTGFLVFEATLVEQDCTITQRFVLNLPIDNEPADRMDRILAAMVGDQGQLIRLLWLLLQKEGDVANQVNAFTTAFGGQNPQAATAESYPIFEPLVQSLTEGRKSVDEVGRLLSDLRGSAEGEALIPDGLYALWLAAKQCADEMDERKRSA